MSEFSTAKLLLSVYRKLPTAVQNIDNAVDKAVKKSFYYHAGQSTLAICNNIIELNSLKDDYINLKVLVDKATSRLLSEDRKLLHLRYIKCKAFLAIAEECNRSLRQTFRLFDNAIESFGCS